MTRRRAPPGRRRRRTSRPRSWTRTTATVIEQDLATLPRVAVPAPGSAVGAERGQRPRREPPGSRGGGRARPVRSRGAIADPPSESRPRDAAPTRRPGAPGARGEERHDAADRRHPQDRRVDQEGEGERRVRRNPDRLPDLHRRQLERADVAGPGGDRRDQGHAGGEQRCLAPRQLHADGLAGQRERHDRRPPRRDGPADRPRHRPRPAGHREAAPELSRPPG